MGKLIKHKKDYIPWLVWTALLIVGYFLTRLMRLTELPIFTDEAIYIRWAQIGSRDPEWRFISLVDGKQPLYTWILMVLLKFIKDPIFAGRLVSVFAGFGTMVGLYLVSYELFRNKKISFLTSFIYLVSPFSLMYDRMALYDSLTAALSVWNLYLSVLLVKYLRLDISLILGMMLSAGMLNKTSGFFSIYLLPLTLLLFDWKTKNIVRRISLWILLVSVSIVLSYLLYSVLRLSPLFHMIKQKDATFVYSFSEWIKHPFLFFIGNMKGLFDWLIHYLTDPIFILAIAQFFFVRSKVKEKLLLYVWCFVPFISLGFFGKVLYPRFILFMAMPLYALAAVSIYIVTKYIKKVFVKGIVTVLFILQSVWISYFIMFNPIYAGIPHADKNQYIRDWPSGYGVKEICAYLSDRAKKGKVTIYTDGTFGLFPYAVEIYLIDNPNIEIVGLWPIPEKPTKEIEEDMLDHPTYLVLNQTRTAPNWGLELLSEYKKGDRADITMRLYSIMSFPQPSL